MADFGKAQVGLAEGKPLVTAYGRRATSSKDESGVSNHMPKGKIDAGNAKHVHSTTTASQKLQFHAISKDHLPGALLVMEFPSH